MKSMTFAAHRFALKRWLCGTLVTRQRIRRRTKLILSLLLFAVSFAVKSLQAVDLEPVMHTAEQPGAGMSREFDTRAVSIVAGEGILMPDSRDPSDTSLVALAPGYPIFLSAVYWMKGRNYFTVQLIQNAINSLCPVLMFLIAGNLIGWRVGVVSGLLAAVSHHQSYYSNLVLSDSICALPILIAVYVLVIADSRRRASLWLYGLAGFMIGLSAWIRPNPMLMGLAFAGLLVVIAGKRRRVILNGVVLASASFLTIAPITIRNYALYGAFVPIRIGIGIILWEGLADVSDGRFGATSDDEVIRQEVALYDDPRYGDSWASPDGIKRDRDRLTRSFDVIARHPVWFFGTTFRRMAEMLKDTADAPLVFRSTDTKLKEALSLSRAAARNRRKPKERSDPALETIDRSALTIGKSLSWLRPSARAFQRATKETGLPFILVGLAFLLAASPRRASFILVVPLYYLLFQSVMHTEFRYTLTMRYFLFVLAAVTWTLLIGFAMTGLRAGVAKFAKASNTGIEQDSS